MVLACTCGETKCVSLTEALRLIHVATMGLYLAVEDLKTQIATLTKELLEDRKRQSRHDIFGPGQHEPKPIDQSLIKRLRCAVTKVLDPNRPHA